MEEIGVVGLGLLGSAIADRLRACGFRVVGYDIAGERRRELQELGGVIADSVGAVAARCRRLFLSLPNSRVAGEVLGQIEDSLRSGSIVLDTTTGDPADAVSFAGQLAGRDAVYLETNVAGSSRQVRERDAIVICAGDENAYHACSELIVAISRRSFFMGPAGNGNRMKLVLNLVLGLNRAVLAEGLAFAEANGIAAARALEVLQAGPAYSRVMDTKGSKMIHHDFIPEARLSQHLKDVRLILQEAGKRGIDLPLSDVHRHLLEQLEAAGFGGDDNSAIIRAFQRRSD